ncbi:FLUCTUATING-LIGHT-ACCLIMATION protein 1, chloroplastic [Physcomitrium patens]|uniref:DUF1517 domain-containing protein n=1 Tax=Physcomitrium patens TaxID=3218 RepID=A0A2K1IB78_PHYPA|nr:uncharacterized protein LOC112278023 [Physcomitrium patens]PNR26536.1 hypothetical protein PHYPA_030016 [Physcomitrium patens]|eukprot:XP_024366778.1 uncharacterized protein LOC112278023 [Physcomitrella patens]
MAVAVAASSHIAFRGNTACSSSAPWKALALNSASFSESHLFGTGIVSLCTRRVTITCQRRFFKCIEVALRHSEKDVGDGVNRQGAGEMWQQLVDRISKPTMVIILSLLLTQSNAETAFAAGGGRVGGKVGGGSSFSSKSYSAPSRSYSGSPSGGYATPRQYIAPSPGFSYAVPYAAPSPFFGGGLYAAPSPFFGIGLGGGSIFFLVILGFIVLQAVYGFVSERSGLGGSLLNGSQKVSVLKLQVGLLGMGRTLQRDLDRIAGQADTITAEGLHYVLTETCLALLRHPDYCISGFTSHDINRSISMAEERFNSYSLEERGKFDEETLVNVSNLRKRMMGAPKADRFNNEYIVVTILVAAEGEYKLPAINGNADLKAALRKLGSISADSIQAVEVLWTPQDENDTLSERELLRDYPLLRSL